MNHKDTMSRSALGTHMQGCYVLAVRKSDGKSGYVTRHHLWDSINRLSSDPNAVLLAIMDDNLYGCGFEDEQARYYIVDPTKPNIVDMMVEAQQYKEAGL